MWLVTVLNQSLAHSLHLPPPPGVGWLWWLWWWGGWFIVGAASRHSLLSSQLLPPVSVLSRQTLFDWVDDAACRAPGVLSAGGIPSTHSNHRTFLFSFCFIFLNTLIALLTSFRSVLILFYLFVFFFASVPFLKKKSDLFQFCVLIQQPADVLLINRWS